MKLYKLYKTKERFVDANDLSDPILLGTIEEIEAELDKASRKIFTSKITKNALKWRDEETGKLITSVDCDREYYLCYLEL